MNIVFMGTPEFAVPCLKALIESDNKISGVFTQPDKPKGRGHKVLPPPVKELALKYDIPVFQPQSLKDEEVYKTLTTLSPDVIIVVAYGKILPEEILSLPKYGCINIHASLLPKYRGAGPIQWSVLNGETETGVTSMYMEKGLDTGDMLIRESIPIGENETASELHDRLSILGAKVLIKTLDEIKNGTLKRTKQDDEHSSYAPMLTKELSKLDFTLPAKQVHNKIRGLSEWPCAKITLLGKTLKVYKSEIASNFSGSPGELLCEKTFVVGCSDNTAIRFMEVQYEGSKRMAAQDFLRGHPLTKGMKLND